MSKGIYKVGVPGEKAARFPTQNMASSAAFRRARAERRAIYVRNTVTGLIQRVCPLAHV